MGLFENTSSSEAERVPTDHQTTRESQIMLLPETNKRPTGLQSEGRSRRDRDRPSHQKNLLRKAFFYWIMDLSALEKGEYG
jgi:hypothetical protein